MFLSIIDEVLTGDRQVHRKQRHTSKRIFEQLRDEHGYDGGWTLVKDAVRPWRQQHQEVFLPLSHPSGEAQVDFGFADVWLEGELTKLALFVITLPDFGRGLHAGRSTRMHRVIAGKPQASARILWRHSDSDQL